MKNHGALLLVLAFVLSQPVHSQIFRPVAPVAAPVGAPAAGLAGPALDFARSPDQLRADYMTATARLDGDLAKIAALKPENANFQKTVKAFEQATASWSREMAPIGFLTAVSPDASVRAAAHDLEKEMDKYSVALSHREDLYKLFEAAAAKGEKLDEADQRLLDGTLKGFRSNGFALAKEDREKLKAMQERMGELSSAFQRNIDEKKDALLVDDEGVKGLPADFVSTLEKADDGRYKVPVDEPSYVTYMRYADSAEHRKAMLVKYQNRGGQENLAVLRETLGLRRDVAQLLGYKSYPEMALKDRMAQTPERVFEFLGRVKDVVLDRARKDIADLLEVKRRSDPAASEVQPWDRTYLARQLKQERYAYDAQEVRQYFPVDRVVDGTMKVYQKVLGLSFKELKGGPAWEQSVRLFEISDAKTGRRIGRFYLDLVPREGKHGHPAAYSIVQGRVREDGAYEEPASAMVADFPVAAPGRPSLLEHGDVETFFHEFGHLMHQTLTNARYASFSGSSVARDFVEAPSQMLENFVWERNVLDELSGHWQTGERLPEELFKKMTAARGFQTGAQYAGQVALAMGDMVLHTTVPDDVSGVFNKILQDMTGVKPAEGSNFVASFGHLLGGYGAGYYGYLWSKVFAEDIYTFFKADGVISPKVGERYRREILEWGSQRPESESLKAFEGREPSEEAFMRELRGQSGA